MNYIRRAGRYVRKKIRHHHQWENENGLQNSTSDHHGGNNREPQCEDDSPIVNDPAKFLHNDAVTCVAVLEPGVSVSGSKDNTVALFDYKKNSVRAKWDGHNKEITRVVAGGNGRVYSASRDRTVRAWAEDSGHDAVQVYNGHNLVVTALDISSGNDRLCSGSRDNSVKLWDIETASCIRSASISRNLVTDLKLGRQRSIIVQTSEDKQLHMWDSRNLSIIQTYHKKVYIQTCCALAEDEMYCLTASNGFGGNGCEATLWDLRLSAPILEYKGHGETVAACAFIPSLSGRDLIMTSSHDSTVRVWDRNTAACVCMTSVPSSGPLTSIAVNLDNTFLVSTFKRGIALLRLDECRNGEFRLVLTAVF